MISFKKKSQGEIFGVALFFILIVMGILIYSKFATNVDDSQLNEKQKIYEILATNGIISIMKSSTGCFVERGQDSVEKLIDYCLEETFFSGNKAIIKCSDNIERDACIHSKEIINNSLNSLFNTEVHGLGPIPFYLTIQVPKKTNSPFYDINITNFGEIKYKNLTITLNNYRQNSFFKANSGPYPWISPQGEIEVELYLYYR